MTTLEQVKSHPVPETLYHYTNGAGMQGIVTNASIWCTHTQYLNDVREFHHAIELFRDEIARRTPKDEKEGHFLHMLHGVALWKAETVNVCVASFSTKSDSLSQWRAYASAPGGFALGFEGTSLKQVAEKNNAKLLPCIYEEKAQLALVKEIVDLMIESGDVFKADKIVSKWAPIFKHKAFEDEQEWRIITPARDVGDNNFHFRPGASMLVPYFSLKIAKQPSALKITEVKVGPCPSPAPSVLSATMFFKKHGLEPKIEASGAPFRSW